MRKLTKREAEVIRTFERTMRDLVIPEMLREIRAREEAWREISTMILD